MCLAVSACLLFSSVTLDFLLALVPDVTGASTFDNFEMKSERSYSSLKVVKCNNSLQVIATVGHLKVFHRTAIGGTSHLHSRHA